MPLSICLGPLIVVGIISDIRRTNGPRSVAYPPTAGPSGVSRFVSPEPPPPPLPFLCLLPPPHLLARLNADPEPDSNAAADGRNGVSWAGGELEDLYKRSGARLTEAWQRYTAAARVNPETSAFPTAAPSSTRHVVAGGIEVVPRRRVATPGDASRDTSRASSQRSRPFHNRSTMRRCRLVRACRDFLCQKPVSAINVLTSWLVRGFRLTIRTSRCGSMGSSRPPAAGRVLRDVGSGFAEAAPRARCVPWVLSDRLRPPPVRAPRVASLRADRIRPVRGG